MITKTKRAVKIKRTAVVLSVLFAVGALNVGLDYIVKLHEQSKSEDKCVANFISSGVHRAQIETRNGYCYLAEGVIL